MAVYSTAGAKIYVSESTPATEDQAGYEPLSWTEIKRVTDLGTIGAEINEVVFTEIGDNTVRKRKGSVNYGSQSVSYVEEDTDPGQLILDAAIDSPDPLSFKVERIDGACTYYQALMMGKPVSYGTSDDMIMITATNAITSKPVKVAAP